MQAGYRCHRCQPRTQIACFLIMVAATRPSVWRKTTGRTHDGHDNHHQKFLFLSWSAKYPLPNFSPGSLQTRRECVCVCVRARVCLCVYVSVCVYCCTIYGSSSSLRGEIYGQAGVEKDEGGRYSPGQAR